MEFLQENDCRIDFTLPSFREIPNIGLFLDQTQKYITEYTEPLGIVTLTGSMISNYVKKKLISNPVKKQYSREQIAYLFFISITKTVLSLEDILLLIKLQQSICDTETAYEFFRGELQRVLCDSMELPCEPEPSPLPNEQALLIHNVITTLASKVYLEKKLQQLRPTSQS